MASAAAPYRGVQREWKGREAVGWRRLPRRGRFLLVFADFDDVSKVYREPACIIPTVKLNCLAMKRQKAAISIPLYQKPAPPREQIIIFVVKVGHEITTGTGPKKKIAKRNASKAMLLQLGYKASSLLQEQSETLEEIKRWNCQNVGCPEPKNVSLLIPEASLALTGWRGIEGWKGRRSETSSKKNKKVQSPREKAPLG